MPPTAVAAAADSVSADSGKVNNTTELLFRTAERFGLPVVILFVVLWWARSDIVQPLLDAHFAVIGKICDGQREHSDQLESIGRKLDELISVSKNR